MYKEKTRQEIEYEQYRRGRDVFCEPNKYGYRYNVNNVVLQQWYFSYCKKIRMRPPPGDEQRKEWEKKVDERIKENYPKHYRRELMEPIIGHRLLEVEELIIMLGLEEGEKL